MITYTYKYNNFYFSRILMSDGEYFTYDKDSEQSSFGYYILNGEIEIVESDIEDHVGYKFNSEFDEQDKKYKQYIVRNEIRTEYDPRDIAILVPSDNTYRVRGNLEYCCISKLNDEILPPKNSYLGVYGKYTLPPETAFILVSGEVFAEDKNLIKDNYFRARYQEIEIVGKEAIIILLND